MAGSIREVKICDVSLRDGMQILNRHAVIPLEERLELAAALVRAGLPYIEVGSFVNPRVVPAMHDTTELLERMPPYDGQIAALAPTLGYYEHLKKAPQKRNPKSKKPGRKSLSRHPPGTARWSHRRLFAAVPGRRASTCPQ